LTIIIAGVAAGIVTKVIAAKILNRFVLRNQTGQSSQRNRGVPTNNNWRQRFDDADFVGDDFDISQLGVAPPSQRRSDNPSDFLAGDDVSPEDFGDLGGDMSDECSICFDDGQSKWPSSERMRNIVKSGDCACITEYHRGCIEQWLTTKFSCPTCRRNMQVRNLK